MRIASVSADSVTTDAVGSGPLLVTAGAQQNVSPRLTAMLATNAGIVAHPARRVGIHPIHPVATHASLDVAGVARRRLVTARAPGRLGPSLDRVPDQEITAVDEIPIHRLGPPPLDAHVLCHVVALVAVRLLVARLAEPAVPSREIAVMADEIPLVSQETARQRTGEIFALVAWSALALFPLNRVLVTREALLHRGELRSPIHNASVTLHALPRNLGHPQVPAVIEMDVARRPIRLHRENSVHASPIVLVATVAQGGIRQPMWSVRLCRSVAAIAAQTRWLSRSPAGAQGKVLLVRETRRQGAPAGP